MNKCSKVHTWLSIVMAQHTLLSVWSQDSDDNCDREVGESGTKKETWKFQAYWKSNFPCLEYNMVVQNTFIS